MLKIEGPSKESSGGSSSVNLFCSEESINLASPPSFAGDCPAGRVSEFEPILREQRVRPFKGTASEQIHISESSPRNNDLPALAKRSWGISEVEEDIKEIQRRVGAIWMR